MNRSVSETAGVELLVMAVDHADKMLVGTDVLELVGNFRGPFVGGEHDGILPCLRPGEGVGELFCIAEGRSEQEEVGPRLESPGCHIDLGNTGLVGIHLLIDHYLTRLISTFTCTGSLLVTPVPLHTGTGKSS